MAADAAHITSTISDDDRPSVFDIVAQESMLKCLQPAVEHITNVNMQTIFTGKKNI